MITMMTMMMLVIVVVVVVLVLVVVAVVVVMRSYDDGLGGSDTGQPDGDDDFNAPDTANLVRSTHSLTHPLTHSLTHSLPTYHCH